MYPHVPVCSYMCVYVPTRLCVHAYMRACVPTYVCECILSSFLLLCITSNFVCASNLKKTGGSRRTIGLCHCSRAGPRALNSMRHCWRWCLRTAVLVCACRTPLHARFGLPVPTVVCLIAHNVKLFLAGLMDLHKYTHVYMYCVCVCEYMYIYKYM